MHRAGRCVSAIRERPAADGDEKTCYYLPFCVSHFVYRAIRAAQRNRIAHINVESGAVYYAICEWHSVRRLGVRLAARAFMHFPFSAISISRLLSPLARSHTTAIGLSLGHEPYAASCVVYADGCASANRALEMPVKARREHCASRQTQQTGRESCEWHTASPSRI